MKTRTMIGAAICVAAAVALATFASLFAASVPTVLIDVLTALAAVGIVGFVGYIIVKKR